MSIQYSVVPGCLLGLSAVCLLEHLNRGQLVFALLNRTFIIHFTLASCRSRLGEGAGDNIILTLSVRLCDYCPLIDS